MLIAAKEHQSGIKQNIEAGETHEQILPVQARKQIL